MYYLKGNTWNKIQCNYRSVIVRDVMNKICGFSVEPTRFEFHLKSTSIVCRVMTQSAPPFSTLSSLCIGENLLTCDPNPVKIEIQPALM